MTQEPDLELQVAVAKVSKYAMSESGDTVEIIERPHGGLAPVGDVLDAEVGVRRVTVTGVGPRWAGVELSEDNHRQLWVPAGFAHGFLVLSDSADFLYKTTDYYAPAHERCIVWNDASLGINWPALDVAPQLSQKDMAGHSFDLAEVFP